MKSSSLLLLTFMFIAHLGFSQGNDEPETLLGSGIYSYSGFGGPMLTFTNITGESTVMSGGGGAVLLNQTFYIGGYGMSNAGETDYIYNGTNYDLDFGHGGFLLGYIFKPKKLVHIGLSTRLGWGSIELDETTSGNFNEFIDDNTFTINPQVDVELNVTQWFRINTGIGYQYTTGVNTNYFESDDFNSLAVGLSFLFGWFN